MPSPALRPLATVQVVAPNLSFHYSGLTSTLITLLPHHSRDLGVAALGRHVPSSFPHVRWRDIFTGGWRPPAGRRFRIWHARGNHDMIAGLVLRHVLRQPWRLAITYAGQRRYGGFTRWLIASMDRVIATSPASAANLDRAATVIMHGVDTARFHPPEDRAAEWAATGLPGRYGIGIFGRVREQKGTDLFVDAMIALLPERPEWTAVVIGAVAPRWKAYADALRERVAAAGLADRVRLLGEQPVEEIPVWYRRLSLVVAPPRTEGFGLVPLEAMASATPLVASDAGAHAALVDDPATGRLVPADDAAALTAAIGDITDRDPADREAIGKAGRARVMERFSAEREAAAIESVYEALRREASASAINLR